MKIKKVDYNFLAKIGVKVVERKTYADSRGKLDLLYEGEAGVKDANVSIKRSISKSNVGRGLHYQTAVAPQSKIISVESGSILDFVYDMSTPAELIYFYRISASDEVSILIPETFAHGFITLEETVFSYTCFGRYSEADEITINILPEVAKELGLGEIVQSYKDSRAPRPEFDFMYEL